MKLSIIVPVYNMASDHRLTWCLESLVQQRAYVPGGDRNAAQADSARSAPPEDPSGHRTGSGTEEMNHASCQAASEAEGDPPEHGVAGGEAAPLQDYEIIAVDDCSTDGSMGILNAYAARYPGRVKVLRGDRNRHQGGAKNQALAHAAGEWIAFIDADDWVVPDYFARLLHKAQETGADCVGTDYCIVHEHTMQPGPVVANSRAEQTGVIDEARRRSLLVDFGSLCVKIYRREIVLGETNAADRSGSPDTAERLDVFPEDIFYEDNAIAKTWVMRIHRYEYVPGPLYYYYQHDDSTVHTVSLRRLEDRRISGRLMVEEARRRGYLEKYQPELEYSFIVLFYKNTLFGAMQSLTKEEVKRASAEHAADTLKAQNSKTGAAKTQEIPSEDGKSAGAPGRGTYRSVYDFVTDLGNEMRRTFPDFQENSYYQARIDAEEKKLIAMQMRSPGMFYLYYRLLWLYRRVRYAKT